MAYSSRHCIALLLSLAASNASLRAVSSFQPRAPIGGISRAAPTVPMPPSRSRSSALSAKAGAQTQFVTNKRCPFAQKAWIALEASECPYEMREVSLYGAGVKPDWFWALNPAGTVPIVAVKDASGSQEVFADSELILDAVEEGRVSGKDGKLLASGLSDDERARADEWRRAISKQLIPVGRSAVLGGSLPKLRSLLLDLDGKVVGPYLAGEQMTVADCAAFPFFWRIDQEFGIGKDAGEERLRAWLDRCMATEAIMRTMPVQGWWWWW